MNTSCLISADSVSIPFQYRLRLHFTAHTPGQALHKGIIILKVAYYPIHPYRHFQLYSQSKDILLSVSALNTQGLRVTIVVVQVGAVKIYVAAMESLRQKDETQFTTKIGGKISFGSQLFSFVKLSFLVVNFSFSIPGLMPYFAETGHSHPLIK